MTQDEITKMFEGRWRIKSQNIDIALNEPYSITYVRNLCRDFFEVGILLGEGFSVAEDEQLGTVIYKHHPILDTDDEGFSEWWDLYDKKIDRAKCEKKWAKLSTKEKLACIAATPAYVASTPDLQYRRHPATYLNNKSWNNQIIPRNNATDKPTIDQQRLDKLADILA